MIYQKIKALCEARNVSISRVEKDCKLGNGTISGWKTGSPNANKLKAVADYFGVTVDYLLREEDSKEG